MNLNSDIESRVAHAVDAALGRKAIDLDVLSLVGITTIADYFIICSATSERQSGAIADAIEEQVKKEDGVYPLVIEGSKPGRWILMDYGDFIVHVFTEDTRRFYGLERLWGDAPNVTERFVPEQAKKANAAKK